MSPGSHAARLNIHYPLALAGYAASLLVAIVNVWAYYEEGMLLTRIGFAAAALATVLLLTAWFWGVFLVMNGLILQQRMIYLTVHATLGSVSSLLYTIVIGLQMDTLGSQPVSGADVSLELGVVAVLTLQLLSGWIMLRRRLRGRLRFRPASDGWQSRTGR